MYYGMKYHFPNPSHWLATERSLLQGLQSTEFKRFSLFFNTRQKWFTKLFQDYTSSDSSHVIPKEINCIWPNDTHMPIIRNTVVQKVNHKI